MLIRPLYLFARPLRGKYWSYLPEQSRAATVTIIRSEQETAELRELSPRGSHNEGKEKAITDQL